MRWTGQSNGHATHGASFRFYNTHRKGGSLPQRLTQLVIALLLLIAPWMFGSTEDWSWAILQGLVGLAALFGVWAAYCRRNATPPSSSEGQDQTENAAGRQPIWSWSWGAPLLGLAAYMAAQAANPSHMFFHDELLPIPHSTVLPRTIDAATTCQTLLKFLTYAGLFWAVRVAFTERHHAWALLTALVISGFLLALAGLSQKLSGSDLLLGIRKASNPHFIFGPFVNRNNYASYVNLLIPVAFAVAHHRRHVAQGRNARSHGGGLFTFMALMMVLSVIMTTSRAGIVLCAGILLTWGAIEVYHVVRGGGEAWRMFLLVAVVAVALMGGLFSLGTKAVQKRLAEMRDVPAELAASGGRGTVYKATLEMFRDHWLFGIGAGTFSMAYPYYSKERMDWFRRYAHNDWLQYLAELGLFGATLLGALGIAVAREQWKARSSGGAFDWLTAALWIGLGSVALHAWVDFPMHIPSIALLVVAFASLLTIRGLRRHQERHERV